MAVLLQTTFKTISFTVINMIHQTNLYRCKTTLLRSDAMAVKTANYFNLHKIISDRFSY